MKAIVYQEYGSTDVLQYTDVDVPTVGDNEVLVRVHAASINYADRFALHGVPAIGRLGFGLRRPRRTILGRDVAGVVSSVGAEVTGFRVGDEVFGESDQQGFAEYVAMPQAHLATIPAGVTFAQAATLPVAGTTALQAMRLGGVGPGRTVLVNGASGGVGLFAVQLAKTLGAEVTAVCSARNADLARSVGADHVIDYVAENFTEGSGRFDVVVDLAGGHRLSDFRRVLTPKGVYVSSSGTGSKVLGPLPHLLAVLATSPFVSQRLRVLVAKRDVADLNSLADLVATGKLTPVVDHTYPLSETANAIRFLEEEHASGKVVLSV